MIGGKGIVVYKNGDRIGSINEEGLEKASDSKLIKSISGVGVDHSIYLETLFIPRCPESKEYDMDENKINLGEEVIKCLWCGSTFEKDYEDLDDDVYAIKETSKNTYKIRIKDINKFRKDGKSTKVEEKIS